MPIHHLTHNFLHIHAEFFFLPEIFINSNRFDYSSSQLGEKVDDVILPPWAHGSAAEFVRLNRAALESRYVSEHLHEWIDLIFGFKQRGPAAREAQNLFVEVVYGEVDVEAIEDDFERSALISQVENFGLAPFCIFKKPLVYWFIGFLNIEH